MSQTDRGDAGGRAGGDDLGGWLVAQTIIGDQAYSKRTAFQKLCIAAETVTQGGKVGQSGFTQPQGLEVSQVVGFSAD